MNSHLTGLLAQLYGNRTIEYSCDTHSSLIRTVKSPVPVQLTLDLAALAELLQRDLVCLSGDLLSAAIQDAISQLSPERKIQWEEIKTAQAQAERKNQLESIWWDAGCP